MRRVIVWRIVLGCLLALPFGLGFVDCQAKTYVTCTGLCEQVLPPCTIPGIDAGNPYDECIAFCSELEAKCEAVGRRAVFLDYVACATDAGFSCTEGGPPPVDAAADARPPSHVRPIANAPCGIQQAELVQCEAIDGQAPLDVVESAYDPGIACLDAGSCLSCCEMAYEGGAKEYRTAVTACVCGEGGACASACVDDAGKPAAACAGKPTQPVVNGPCDKCLAAVLDEQSLDAGACVVPVTLRCNQTGNVACALYANCVSQSGCTN
jgi:hypothetical protein